MKKHAKIVALVLALVMCLTIFAGCSSSTLNYLKLSKEMNAHDAYAFSGTMNFDIDYQPIDVTAEEQESVEMALDLINGLDLDYTGELILSDFTYHMDIGFNLDGKRYPIEFYMSPSKMLVNAADIIAFANNFCSEEEAAANIAAFEGVEWIDLYAEVDYDMSVLEDLSVDEVNQLLYDLMDILANGAFKNYDPKIFGTKGNGYTMTLDAEKLDALATGFITYFIDNYDAIIDDLDKWADGIPNEMLAAAELTAADVDMLFAELRGLEFAAEDKASALSAIDTVCNYLEGSELTSYYEKTGTNKYKASESITLDLSAFSEEALVISLTADMVMDASKPVQIVLPTTGKSVNDVADAVKADEVSGTFYLEDKIIYWDKAYAAPLLNHSGAMDVEPLLINSLNYFPLRQIGELFDENVV